MRKLFCGLFFTTLIFLGCSSKPTFQPEVSGKGVLSSHGGVIYSIPPKNPVLRMKLVASGVTKDNMLLVRMFFLRKGPPAGEFLDPKEQSILLPDGRFSIIPSKVHANGAAKPLIKLTDSRKQGVELLFPLPTGGHEYPFINLNWKLHYKTAGQDKIMAQTERFDFISKNSPQQGVGNYSGDLEFPDVESQDIYGEKYAGWFDPDWIWW